MNKRTAEQLRFIRDGAKEVTRQIYRKALREHVLTIEECEQLHVLETAHRNACVNLNQKRMQEWGK